MKVVINKSYGGFGLSQKAYERLNELGIPIVDYPTSDEYEKVIFRGSIVEGGPQLWDAWLVDDRSNPLLIEVVEELGNAADGKFSELKIVNIPDDIIWHIYDDDGVETIHEEHRSWG